MLGVKLLEMGHNPALRRPDGEHHTIVHFGLVFGWLATIGFAIWLFAQGLGFDQYGESAYSSSHSSYDSSEDYSLSVQASPEEVRASADRAAISAECLLADDTEAAMDACGR